MGLKAKTNMPDEEAPISDGFRPVEISAWVAECRSRLRRITCGEERHRAGLMAEARMRLALDQGEPLDRTLARTMEFYRDHQRDDLPAEILSGIDRKVATGNKIRSILEEWTRQDDGKGVCCLENAACRSLLRLEYLSAQGWLPEPSYAVRTAIRATKTSGSEAAA
jgi:hypothetical protein